MENESTYRCVTPVQLRYNDIDTHGHVNNTVYFSLFDLGKSDYFNAVRGEKMDWNSVPVVMVNVNCDFMEQTRYDERLEVLTRVVKLGNKSFTMEHALRNSDTGHLKCVCRAVMVYMDLATGMPAPLSDDWREDITRYEQGGVEQ